jgi:hypothetical protein
MVLTDLVMRQYDDEPEELERVRPIFSILADRVERVTPWLAQRILANSRNGAVISWLPWWKLAGRFALSPFRRRDPFEDLEAEGEPC